MPLSANEFARIAIMQFFPEQQDAGAVQGQLQSIKVIDCNVTPVGIVCRFHVDPDAPKVRSGATGSLGGLEGTLLPSGVKCGFELWIECGHIASLEAFTYSADWPHAIEACQFSPTDHIESR